MERLGFQIVQEKEVMIFFSHLLVLMKISITRKCYICHQVKTKYKSLEEITFDAVQGYCRQHLKTTFHIKKIQNLK